MYMYPCVVLRDVSSAHGSSYCVCVDTADCISCRGDRVLHTYIMCEHVFGLAAQLVELWLRYALIR